MRGKRRGMLRTGAVRRQSGTLRPHKQRADDGHQIGRGECRKDNSDRAIPHHINDATKHGFWSFMCEKNDGEQSPRLLTGISAERIEKGEEHDP